jgi:glutamate:Na+ symporter, ESS family
MVVSPWLILIASVPVFLLGEWTVGKIGVLSRFNIPAPVVGGLGVCLLVLLANLLGLDVQIQQKVDARWWNWFVLSEKEWLATPSPPQDVYRVFLVGFFVAIGLNASWRLAARAGLLLLVFTGIAGLLAVLQNVLGVGLALAMGQSPFLGLLCGSISMTGGHGTAIGFSDVLVKLGFEAAPVVGIAAATFGLVSASLLGGPIGGRLITSRRLSPDPILQTTGAAGDLGSKDGAESSGSGFLGELKALAATGRLGWFHLFVILACIKAGAWVSLFLTQAGLVFPVYIGAMMVGVLTRNLLDVWKPGLINVRVVDLFASVCLGVFLSVAMMTLNLIDLANAAGPMLVILFAQVGLMALYANFVTFRVMGRDYDAAVTAAGHCGFGLGATPAAVANMKALTEKFGVAPRAFLIVPLVGAFLIDFINSSVILGFIQAISAMK